MKSQASFKKNPDDEDENFTVVQVGEKAKEYIASNQGAAGNQKKGGNQNQGGKKQGGGQNNNNQGANKWENNN